jgi:hypothetical protein
LSSAGSILLIVGFSLHNPGAKLHPESAVAFLPLSRNGKIQEPPIN